MEIAEIEFICNLLKQPKEVLYLIFKYLQPEDWLNLRLTNSILFDLINQNDYKLWKDYSWKQWTIKPPCNGFKKLKEFILNQKKQLGIWVGYCTQLDSLQYPAHLNILERNGLYFEGLCKWATFMTEGNTKVKGKIDEENGIAQFTEYELIQGPVSVPNPYVGFFERNFMGMVYFDLREIGITFLVKKNVAIVSDYNEEYSCWEGYELRPTLPPKKIPIKLNMRLQGNKQNVDLLFEYSSKESFKLSAMKYVDVNDQVIFETDIDIDFETYGIEKNIPIGCKLKVYEDMIVGLCTYCHKNWFKSESVSPNIKVGRHSILYLKKM